MQPARNRREPVWRQLQGVPGQLWRLVKLARHRLLMVEYDGTLAPFQVRRETARPLPRARELLAEIEAGGRTSVAVASGRPVKEVAELIGRYSATIVGEHGWERTTRDGEVVRWCPPDAALGALEKAQRDAARQGWKSRLERKRASLVLHTRDLSTDAAAAAEAACGASWRTLCCLHPVGLDRINGGLELRALGRDKGTALFSLLSHESCGTLAVFVGDNASNEAAFRTVRDLGFGVQVGSEEQPSLAAARLPSCHAVVEFLEAWRNLLGTR